MANPQFDKCIPVTIVIFGATGDLTWRKLIPSLYVNYKKGRLPECTLVVGFARRPWTDDEFRSRLRASTVEALAGEFDPVVWDSFASMLHYFQGTMDSQVDIRKLEPYLRNLEQSPSNRLYYLATTPDYFSVITESLGSAGMGTQTGSWRRIVVEKPFGHDLRSAQTLNQELHKFFQEDQIYRMDHYLGKETAQNILYFRFANTIFEPAWNHTSIDHVQITVTEDMDVGHRATYYDKAGVVRDMFQNHLLQLLALVAMESPSSFTAEAIRDERMRVYRAIRPIRLADTVHGQYDGFCGTENIAPGSQTPTFAAWKMWIDNHRWRGVPFYLRSGKTLKRKLSEIAVTFRRPIHKIFEGVTHEGFPTNILTMCLQPDEGIHLGLDVKIPDKSGEMRLVDMSFQYRTTFQSPLPDAYERLLLDAIKGDASLFTRNDSIEKCWRLVDPVLRAWERKGVPPLVTYPRGSWGPREAEELITRDGRAWHEECSDQTN